MPVMLFAASLLLAAAPFVEARNGVYTPPAGSAERAAIIKTLKGEGDAALRYTFQRFHVFHRRSRAIAYVEGEGGIGGFQAILTREGKAPWRVVWSEGDGGSDSCAAGARHYEWAVRLINSHGVASDTLFPGITARTRELKRMAASEPETQCVGDLDGGPQ